MTNDKIIDRSFHNTCIAGDYCHSGSLTSIKRHLADATIETDRLGNIVSINGQRVIEPNDLGGLYTFESTVGAFWAMADAGL